MAAPHEPLPNHLSQWEAQVSTDELSSKVGIASVVSSAPSLTRALSPPRRSTIMEQQAQQQYATITFPDGKIHQVKILKSTDGPLALDMRDLLDKTGYISYDPGYTSTGSCDSKITFIDGPAGILSHRGYSIQDLAQNSDFMDVTYLLLYGELPNATQKADHTRTIKRHTLVHEKLIQFYKGFKSDAHPMAILVSVVGALSAFYHDSLDISKPAHRMLSAYRIIAKIPTLAAIAYKTSIGQPIVYPRNDLSYVENFLYMMFAVPSEPYEINPVMVRAMETIFILHADHEQNASTSTVRVAGSSRANPFACISAGISALWGPAHGGANEAVLKMLEEIGHKDRIPEFMNRVKDKNDSTRLMGFGHRVYKNYDPRAKIMQKICFEVLESLGMQNDPLLELAVELEKYALADEYFVKRKLYPNVDFYSGIVLRAMGIPVSMFTVLFAVSRTVGWVSQWKESIEDPFQKISRPRQLYTGYKARPFVPLTERFDPSAPATASASAAASAAAAKHLVEVIYQKTE